MDSSLEQQSPVKADYGALPPVEAPAEIDSLAKEESSFLEDGKKLDHSLRSLAGYGALILAVLMYMAGLAAIAFFIGLCPNYGRVSEGHWHLVVSTLVALFSIPTILVLAVLRSAGQKHADKELDSIHSAIGEKVVSVIEKILESK